MIQEVFEDLPGMQRDEGRHFSSGRNPFPFLLLRRHESTLPLEMNTFLHEAMRSRCAVFNIIRSACLPAVNAEADRVLPHRTASLSPRSSILQICLAQRDHERQIDFLLCLFLLSFLLFLHITLQPFLFR